jgi:Tol biopolymer transport system component
MRMIVRRNPCAILIAGLVAALLVGALAGAAVSRAGAQAHTGTIAFIRVDSDKVFGGRLFVVRPDGSALRPLTPPSTRVHSYAWSPDGTLIAYTDSQGSLWLVRPNGTRRRLLLSMSRLQSVSLSWSPDGSRIAITSSGPKGQRRAGCCSELRLYVVPIGGGPPVLLPAGKHIGYGVAWSPRGDEIYYDNGGIWAIHPDGTGRRRISPVGSAASLSADGAHFVFGVAIHLRNGHTDRYRAFGVVNADGTGYRVVTTHAYNEYGEVWSPSGRRILYGRAGGQGIYVIGADGRGNRRVTGDSAPAAAWGALAWSPSGDSIVYDTGGTDDTDLYLIGIDGRGKSRLTSTPDIDIAPSWVAR